MVGPIEYKTKGLLIFHTFPEPTAKVPLHKFRSKVTLGRKYPWLSLHFRTTVSKAPKVVPGHLVYGINPESSLRSLTDTPGRSVRRSGMIWPCECDSERRNIDKHVLVFLKSEGTIIRLKCSYFKCLCVFLSSNFGKGEQYKSTTFHPCENLYLQLFFSLFFSYPFERLSRGLWQMGADLMSSCRTLQQSVLLENPFINSERCRRSNPYKTI